MHHELTRILRKVEGQTPHLMRCIYGVWLCIGCGAIAQGDTREDAQARWDAVRPKQVAA